MSVFVKFVSMLIVTIIPIFAVKQANATGILYYREPPVLVQKVDEGRTKISSSKQDINHLGPLAIQIKLKEDAVLARELANIIKKTKFDEMPLDKKRRIITLLEQNNEQLQTLMKS